MSSPRPFVVITSISAPNSAMRMFAEGAAAHAHGFIVVGDTKSPAGFVLEDCQYYSVEQQREAGFALSPICPTRHYVRKNLGYLLAMREGATAIRDTDDDNFPRSGFWDLLSARQTVGACQEKSWVNVYAWFSETPLWPRGLPLDAVRTKPQPFGELSLQECYCPIQQGLADENPDVDAVYRLLYPLPQNFRTDRSVALRQGAWCPFNSQNTTWYPEAFPLLYLPATCTFRMTDIWRSFVAQRIAWANDWSILFHAPTVWQDRNAHDLMLDFADEVPGYLHNRSIASTLDGLDLPAGVGQIPFNLRLCYEALVKRGWLQEPELNLLEAWLQDLGRLRAAQL